MIAASLSCKVENMTKQWAVAAAVLLLASTIPAGAQAPADPKASPEARALLQTLYSISGRYTLAGQHNYPNHIARWTDRAYDLTGKYPPCSGRISDSRAAPTRTPRWRGRRWSKRPSGSGGTARW